MVLVLATIFILLSCEANSILPGTGTIALPSPSPPSLLPTALLPTVGAPYCQVHASLTEDAKAALGVLFERYREASPWILVVWGVGEVDSTEPPTTSARPDLRMRGRSWKSLITIIPNNYQY